MVDIHILIDLYELTFREKEAFNFGTSLIPCPKNPKPRSFMHADVLKSVLMQDRHGRFLAGKAAIVVANSPACHAAAAAAAFYFSKSSQGPGFSCLASRGGPVMHSHRSVHHDLPHQRRLQIFIHVPQSGPAAHIWGQWGFVKTW